MSRLLVINIAAALLLAPISVVALQASAPELPNQCASKGLSRTVSFDTTEGTMMNLDVSPDGKAIAFDLLGDIYVLPATGGTAIRKTDGLGWNTWPVWSPDGSRIAFISDRSGDEQIHVALNESEWRPSQLTHGDDLPDPERSNQHGMERDLVIGSIAWRRDSKFLEANGVEFSIDDGTKRPALGVAPQDDSISFSNRRHSYRLEKLPSGESGGDGSGRSLRLWRHSPGAPETVAELADYGFDAASVISDDERWIVFRKRSSTPAGQPEATEGESKDYLLAYNLLTERLIVLLEPASSPGWRSNKASGYAQRERISFSPDSEAIFIAYGGHIHRIDLATGRNALVPFHAAVQKELQSMACNTTTIDEQPFQVKSLRSVSKRADNRQLVFSALRRIYTLDYPYNGKPRRLNMERDGQFQPAYSPDGAWIAYVTWSDSEGGHVWRVPSRGGRAERLTDVAGYYQSPAWSPDGRKLAFVASDDKAAPRKGFEVFDTAGNVRILSVSNKSIQTLGAVARFGFSVTFNEGGDRVRFVPMTSQVPSSGPPEMHSIAINGLDTRVDWNKKHSEGYWSASEAVMSPSGKRIAVVHGGNIFIVTCSDERGSITHSDSTDCTETQVTREGGRYPRWRNNSILEWSFANRYYSADVDHLSAGQKNDALSIANNTTAESIPIRLDSESYRAKGSVALRGARIISMRGDEVIEDGTVRVENGRIVAVGPSSNVSIPSGTKVFDLRGKTIAPGLIDAHAHLTDYPRDLLAGNHYEPLAYLAFGVTTVRDPSSGGDHVFDYAELVNSGSMTGPRIFGAKGFTVAREVVLSRSDARALAARYKAIGARFLKIHSGYSREQRQLIIEAAKEYDLGVASHHSISNLFPGRLNLSTIVDGATTIEHDITASSDVFGDVVNFISDSGVMWDIAALYGYSPNKYAYYRFVESDERLTGAFAGYIPLVRSGQPHGDHPEMGLNQRPGSTLARTVAKVEERGGNIMLGAHGERDGVGLHFEMWAHAEGGTSNFGVLREATLNGARSIGVDKDLGSIEVGKLADIVIFDENPLEDIKRTLSASMVMKGGVLYRTRELDEVWPRKRALPPWKMRQ